MNSLLDDGKQPRGQMIQTLLISLKCPQAIARAEQGAHSHLQAARYHLGLASCRPNDTGVWQIVDSHPCKREWRSPQFGDDWDSALTQSFDPNGADPLGEQMDNDAHDESDQAGACHFEAPAESYLP
jgi:hypothetical protein